MTMSEYAIETHSLSKRYGTKLALRDFSLGLRRGGVHALVGSNGAGKSTLFRALLGIIAPSAGSSRVLGHDSQGLTPEVRGKIGLVGEEHTLPGWMPVAALKAMHQSLYPNWNESLYKDVLGHFDVQPGQSVSQLSRGERAGLNLALILAQSPELLFLDEPTLGLDVVAKQAVLESLLGFVDASNGCTIIYCSHQMDEIERVADSLLILERGALTNHSPLDDFCERISQWTVDELPVTPGSQSIPGLLQTRTIDGQHHLIVIDQHEHIRDHLESAGARRVQQIPIGFDRAVNAYLTRNHVAPTA
jgi:ABC-2 type transport system ATP-binding protein